MRIFAALLRFQFLLVLIGFAGISGTALAASTNANVIVQIDAAADRHAISPLIYGVAFASSNQLKDLNVPLNRSGGNATTRYNWTTNASNHANDWYFESLKEESGSGPGGSADAFIGDSKNGGAQAMITMPIIGWVAKLGPKSQSLCSYSIAKYGAQTGNDWQWFPDAGNGVSTNGVDITTNDPTEANLSVGTNFQAGWIQHLTNRWGSAAGAGVHYYIMDNEWSIWHSTHRDVHPTGATLDEVLGKFCDYATLVKGMDSNALVIGPEEWGWTGYLYSGYDQQYGSAHGWSGPFPDRSTHGNQDYMPWLLSQIHSRSQTSGKRLLDVFTLHYYPQGGESSSDVSTSTELLRNRSTRSLWDTNYTDQSWINDVVKLIPRMKQWVATNYPDTKIGITEYNWGADYYPNGATAQADVLGIFGRESLDIATRWTVPDTGTPAYNAFKIFRNYDGNKSTFGDVNVRATVPNPDNLSAFASLRGSDNKLTLVAINKDLQKYTPATFNLTNLPASGTVQMWQLANSNPIVRLPDAAFTNGVLKQTLPAQSITIFVLPGVTTTSTLPALRLGTNNPTGQMELWLDGQAAQTYTLQSSTDLLHWQSVSTNTLSSNSFRFLMTITNPPQLFYRTFLNQP